MPTFQIVQRGSHGAGTRPLRATGRPAAPVRLPMAPTRNMWSGAFPRTTFGHLAQGGDHRLFARFGPLARLPQLHRELVDVVGQLAQFGAFVRGHRFRQFAAADAVQTFMQLGQGAEGVPVARATSPARQAPGRRRRRSGTTGRPASGRPATASRARRPAPPSSGADRRRMLEPFGSAAHLSRLCS